MRLRSMDEYPDKVQRTRMWRRNESKKYPFTPREINLSFTNVLGDTFYEFSYFMTTNERYLLVVLYEKYL